MSTSPSITQQVIDIGTEPNDETGDPLRIAFGKVNNNFANLFPTFLNSTISYTTGNTAGQIIFEIPANVFTQGQFFVRSSDNGTSNSQTIQLYAQLNNYGNIISSTGYGITVIGTAVTGYDMVFNSGTGNVEILSNPLTTDTLTHFISSQIMYAPGLSGADLLADGYVDTAISTESSLDLTTEA